MTTVIREARAEDVPALLTLRLSVRENQLSDPGRVTGASFAPYLADGSAWVAENGSLILGFAVLDLKAASVWALFVVPDAERTGIGRALHDHLIAQARLHGLGELCLNTSPGTRAERFYAAAGWRNSGMNSDGDIMLRIGLE